LGVFIVMSSDLVTVNLELGISSEFLAARHLSECQEASCLEVVEVGSDGKEHLLVPAAASAWRNLKAAALEEGVSLFIVSAFRSITRQTEIVRRKLEAGASIEKCLPSALHQASASITLAVP
jgi:zinc D-Ala-D-Ala carboxypeptidase